MIHRYRDGLNCLLTTLLPPTRRQRRAPEVLETLKPPQHHQTVRLRLHHFAHCRSLHCHCHYHCHHCHHSSYHHTVGLLHKDCLEVPTCLCLISTGREAEAGALTVVSSPGCTIDPEAPIVKATWLPFLKVRWRRWCHYWRSLFCPAEWYRRGWNERMCFYRIGVYD